MGITDDVDFAETQRALKHYKQDFQTHENSGAYLDFFPLEG